MDDAEIQVGEVSWEGRRMREFEIILTWGAFLIVPTLLYAVLFYVGLLVWDSAFSYWAWVFVTAVLGHIIMRLNR